MIAGDQPVCIDEYQKAPVVLDAIKAELNRGATPGRFVLTGSTRHDSLPPAAQALTGRLSRLPVLPLSQGEIGQVHEDLLTRLLRDPESATGSWLDSATSRTDYIHRVTRGGFPLALAASSDAAHRRWVDHYLSLTVERDVYELSRLRQGHMLGSLLARLAGQTAQVLNIEKAARDVGLDKATTDSYVSLLEKLFVVYRLPAWGRTLTSRSAASPKLHVLDSGIAARLLRLTPAKLATPDPSALTELGHVLESFTVGELLKQASWNDDVAGTGHWRTRDGDEVDLVVERDDGALVAFEVKAASRVSGHDLTPTTTDSTSCPSTGSGHHPPDHRLATGLHIGLQPRTLTRDRAPHHNSRPLPHPELHTAPGASRRCVDQLAITTRTAMVIPTIRFCHRATVALGPAPLVRARMASQAPSQLGNATTAA